MITIETVQQGLRQVMHPEIKRNLVELGMIKKVSIQDRCVAVTLALPFKEIPVKDSLVCSVQEAVKKLNSSYQVEVELAEMSQRERAAFMTASGGGPRPAQSGNQIAHVIAIASGKGGVGKSSVATLLAVTLNRQGNRVGVLDADITGPSIPHLFGLHESPATLPTGIVPVKTETGIEVMSINLLLSNKDEAVIWRGPLVGNTIKQFWTDVLWGTLDYLILDLPPGTSDASLTVMQSIPLSGVILVTSPQDLAGMVVRKAARMAQQLGTPILGLVENMSHVVCPKCGETIEIFGPSQAMHTALQLGVPLLGRLPLDPEMASLSDTGKIEGYHSVSFESIVQKVVAQTPPQETLIFTGA
jgi:Mrp family chromosome partitioning ATPase